MEELESLAVDKVAVIICAERFSLEVPQEVDFEGA